MSVLAVVQARMGSQRLPGKVLEPILESAMIDWVVARLAASALIDEIVVATTDQAADDVLARHLQQADVPVFRGPALDVLERFGRVLDLRPGFDEIVRVTADCPFIDGALVDEVVQFRRLGKFDFATNRLPPPASRSYPVGLDVEVCTRAALLEARTQATAAHHREHVMPFLYEDSRFDVGVLEWSAQLGDVRWTVDTAEDLESVRILAREMPAQLSPWREILNIHEGLRHRLPNYGQLQNPVSKVDERWGDVPA